MANAQKKAINEAGNYVKSAKNLDKAEKLMTDLLRDSNNQRNEKIWTTLIDAVKLQYVQGNEKLYLKQKYDTASLFTIARKLFTFCEEFDSIEALPNKKGEVKIKHRTKNAEYLIRIRERCGVRKIGRILPGKRGSAAGISRPCQFSVRLAGEIRLLPVLDMRLLHLLLRLGRSLLSFPALDPLRPLRRLLL